MNYYIAKLECKNIGLFEDLTIEFSPRCNVIIGPNGCGKTSILKIICLGLWYAEMNRIRFGRQASIALYTVEGGVTYAYGGLNLTDQEQQINIFNWGTSTKSLPPGIANRQIPLGNYTSNYKLFAIGAQRHFSYKKIAGMMGEERGKQRLTNYLQNNIKYLDNQSLPDIKQWMINRYFVIEKDWAEIEKENWNYILNYIPKLSPNRTIIKFVKIERELEPVFEINGRQCYLDELSSGFKSILSIIFSIVDWIEGVNDGDQARIQSASGTVLIDEIDVHLHPEWQKNILNLLKSIFENIQFIVTAHSPLVVSSAAENEIIAVPNNSGNVSLKPDTRAFGAWMADDIMSHLMGYNDQNDGSESINPILDTLDDAVANGNAEEFERGYGELINLLSPDDPIGIHYGLKRSELYLNKKHD